MITLRMFDDFLVAYSNTVFVWYYRAQQYNGNTSTNNTTQGINTQAWENAQKALAAIQASSSSNASSTPTKSPSKKQGKDDKKENKIDQPPMNFYPPPPPPPNPHQPMVNPQQFYQNFYHGRPPGPPGPNFGGPPYGNFVSFDFRWFFFYN